MNTFQFSILGVCAVVMAVSAIAWDFLCDPKGFIKDFNADFGEDDEI
jgi:hypothetical protein